MVKMLLLDIHIFYNFHLDVYSCNIKPGTRNNYSCHLSALSFMLYVNHEHRGT